MKKQFTLLLSLLLCLLLLFLGCDVSQRDFESDTETESETVSETESNTLSESEHLSETESDSYEWGQEWGTYPPHTCPGFIDPPAYYQLKNSQAILVRWGTQLDSDNDTVAGNYPMEHEGMVAVKVEVTESYIKTFEGVSPYVPKEEVLAIPVIYLPVEALPYATEGEEALVFLDWPIMVPNSYDPEAVRVYTVTGFHAEADDQGNEEWIFPIFKITDGHISVLPSQQRTNSYGTPLLELMEQLLSGNEFLTEKNDDPSYFFRDGMILDQLEQFFYLTRASRP